MVDLNIELKLDRVHCHDEGDGLGSAEPYLWVAFFKADGDTFVINSDGPSAPYLQGAPTIVGTPGNQGNLAVNDVDEGDVISIPAILGEYRTVMKPIVLTTPILGLSEVGGMIGCIVVLMEEDGTPNSDIARGHEALDREVRAKLTAVLGTLSINKSEPTEEDITAISNQIGMAVKAAIGAGVNVFEWLAVLGNMDDQIGSAVFQFSHKQLEESGSVAIPFSRRWKNEGDWELFGSIKAVPIRRQEPKCCAMLKRRIAELEATILRQEKRIVRIEAFSQIDDASGKVEKRLTKRSNKRGGDPPSRDGGSGV